VPTALRAEQTVRATGVDARPEPTRLPLTEIVHGEPLRSHGLDQAHIRALSEVTDQLPPILVMPGTNVIVDGHHRFEAAKLAGATSIACLFFEGDAHSGLLESIRCNTSHGLPLSLKDREQAATLVLGRYPHWSDRRNARQCAHSPTTVARLRAALDREGEGTTVQSTVQKRVGIDGRARPTARSAAHQRIVDAILDDPSASLRQIAARVGSSPETVRRVRATISMSPGDLEAATAPSHRFVAPPVFREPAPALQWEPDQALLTADEGPSLCEWLERTAPGDHWRRYLGAVPRSRVYLVADEARRRAQYWSDFARALERAQQHS
jgi:hypothetical protein